MTLRSVDLPEPFGPMMPIFSPLAMVSETSSRTVRRLGFRYRFVNEWRISRLRSYVNSSCVRRLSVIRSIRSPVHKGP